MADAADGRRQIALVWLAVLEAGVVNTVKMGEDMVLVKNVMPVLRLKDIGSVHA